MITTTKHQWFGYQYKDGGYQTKPYREPLDIQEAMDSPFVVAVYGPFDADSREEALQLTEQGCKEPL